MMKIPYYPFLLSATIGLFCGSAFVLGQEFVPQEYQLALQDYLEIEKASRLGQICWEEYDQRQKDAIKVVEAELVKAYCVSVNAIDAPKPNELLLEDSNPKFYCDGDDGIRYYRGLQPHGDYTKLKLIVRSEKTDYITGELVWLRFFYHNESDSEVHVCYFPLGSIFHCSYLWKLFHSNYDEAAKTPEMEKIIEARKRSGRHGVDWSYWSGPPSSYIKLQPGQEVELNRNLGGTYLNELFDLSKPDTYELTCFTTSVIMDQEYEAPLQSNTLTFRILEPTGQEPLKYPYEPQHIPYTNPPPGEEVFKQPKPPKNVFYIYTRNVPPPAGINVSP